MLENHMESIENLVKWYVEVKNVILRVENNNKKIYIQLYNELRYSFDHFIRAINWELEKEKTPSITDEQISNINFSVEKAISSSINHLQRAYSDICEWYYLQVKEICNNIIAPYTPEQISKALPNYYSLIKPNLQQIGSYLTVYKENKTSENNNLNDEKNIILFSKQIEQLSEILNQIENAEVSLVELKSKERKSTLFKKIGLPIITAVSSGLIVYIITSILR